jgi:hypothetical protein
MLRRRGAPSRRMAPGDVASQTHQEEAKPLRGTEVFRLYGMRLNLRFYLKYGSGRRLISRARSRQRVLCEIAAFTQRYDRIGQLL